MMSDFLKHWQTHIFFIGYAVLLALFSVTVFPGYNVEKEDQVFYLAPILQSHDSSLYNKDFLMEKSQTIGSIFDETIAFFMSTSEDLYMVLFIAYILTNTVLFGGILLIGKAITNDIRILFSVPLFFFAIHTGGFVCNGLPNDLWNFSFETELHARSFATPFAILAIGLFLHQRIWWAMGISSIALFFHPITILPLFTIFCIATLVNNSSLFPKKIFWQSFSPFIIPFLAIIGFVFFLSQQGGGNTFQTIDSDWMKIMTDTSPYLLVKYLFQYWDSFFLFSFGFLGMGFFILSAPISPLIKRFAISLLISISLLCSIGIIGFEYFHISLFGQLQLLRSILYIKIIFGIIVFIALLSTIPKEKPFGKGLLALSFLGLFIQGNIFIAFFFASGIYLFLKDDKNRILKTTITFVISVASILSLIFFPKGVTIAEWEVIFNLFFTDPKTFWGIILYVIQTDVLYTIGFLFLCTSPTLKRIIDKKQFKKYIVGGIFILFLVSTSIYFQKLNIVQDKHQNTYEGRFYEQIKIRIPNNSLIVAGDGIDGSYVRNRLQKNVFIAFLDKTQGTFIREYSFESQKREHLKQNIEFSISILQDEYKVDYILSHKPLSIEWPIAFQVENFIAYKNPKTL